MVLLDLIVNFSLFFDIAYGSSVYTEIVLQTKYRVLKILQDYYSERRRSMRKSIKDF